MSGRSLLIFDFDGVIVDGMAEYWWSAWHAAQLLDAAPPGLNPGAVPEGFRRLRPWVHHGWEMVLLAAELPCLRLDDWLRQYGLEQGRALQRRGWSASQLQEVLDEARRRSVLNDRSSWLALHQPFPGLVKRLGSLAQEGVDWAVLTTKTEDFTAELLDALGLQPWRLHGREAGPKPQVLLQLQEERRLRGFVEDRRATLEAVRSTAGLQDLACYLVSWGYLKPSDQQDLPQDIRLLRPEQLASPLAQWP